MTDRVEDGPYDVTCRGRLALHADDHSLVWRLLFWQRRYRSVTPYETGLVGHHSVRGAASPVRSNPLITDERFLTVGLRGRGVAVLSARSHVGVVDACLGVQDRFPGTPMHVVLGGYYLAGTPMEPCIGPNGEVAGEGGASWGIRAGPLRFKRGRVAPPSRSTGGLSSRVVSPSRRVLLACG